MASVLASWLDNDEDGCADNPKIIIELLGKFNLNGVQTRAAIIAAGIYKIEKNKNKVVPSSTRINMKYYRY